MSIWNEIFEDKKCRVCGLADLGNINILHDKTLQMKMCTVYPIVLHEDDPLPKNICRKCISSVSSIYNDIQRCAKIQKKWTQNVRMNEPENKYLQTLAFLENATQSIKTLMKTSYGTALSEETIRHFITNALGKNEGPEQTATASGLVNSSSVNGGICSSVLVKTEPPTEDEREDNVKNKVVKTKKSNSYSPSPLPVTCRYCPLQFESLARLALHQNIHLKLQTPKLFQPKYLNKKSRRGRLISVNGSQSIRCLNCWRIFDDNKCILEHWSEAECTFYCQICGEEYEQMPKMLREHVLVDHGVSYKSLKSQRDQLTKKNLNPWKRKYSQKDKKENPNVEFLESPQKKMKANSDKTWEKETSQRKNKAVCRICSRAFQNFKACNSHMRAHKPPFAFSENTPLPDIEIDAYTEMEKKEQDKKYTAKYSQQSSGETTETVTEPISETDSVTVTEPVIETQPVTKTEPISEVDPVNATVSATVPPLQNEATTTPLSFTVYNTENPKANDAICSNEQNKTNTSQITSDARAETICSSADAKVITTQITNNAQTTSTTKISTTAPRGIRMKIVSRRSDLINSGPSIKVKSLSDLQGEKKYFVISNQSVKPVSKVQNVLPQITSSNSLHTSFVGPSNIKDGPLEKAFL